MVEEVKEQPRLQHLKQIEVTQIERCASQKLYEIEALEGYENMGFEEKNATKYLATFPYPYMNGYLHLGHAYSMSKSEFMTRYQRQLGKRALFPFGFHCTGMPISSAAIRLQREIDGGKTRSDQPTKEFLKKAPKDYVKPPLTQYEILMQLDIPETEIPKFTEPHHWLEFFPPLGMRDLKRFGLHTDWRRSFITTDKNPYYDKFIRWQFHHLKENGKIKFGKRYTIFSESERQPCADHDRGSGEGVGPQEYAGIKIRMLELPEKMSQFEGRNVFLVAGTLRPETMYGQTNCFVLPEGDYGVYEMKNDDLFVISHRAARHFAHQEMTKVDFEYPSLCDVKGQELIGKKVKAPMTSYEFVYVLPLPTISMTKGTAVVTSVPSDAPNDYAMLVDLQKKEGLRKIMGVQLEWVQGFDPVPLIDVPGMGDLCAKTAVEEMKIQSHKDTVKLEQAKDKCYQEGFSKGIMKVGIAAGQRVEDAKPIIRKQMYDEGTAVPYYEPEKEVTARTGEPCIVALCDQWLLGYGEEVWREQVREHIQSDRFNTYNPKTQHEFELIIDWLKEWGCSRTTGLGTRVPWDEQFVIESLSDSTIYQAFYTISHMLQGGVLEGSETGPSGIPASVLSVEAFDYIFLGKPFNAAKCPGLTEEQLKPLRHSFEYWYPMDLGVSGKDLIRNHLTMALYNNQAIWQDNEKRQTRSYFCNGYLCLNGQKMSKSTGNFMTLGQCIDKFGTDASRIALADAGDTLDDANFDEAVANQAILKLFVFEQWVETHISKSPLDFSQDDASQYHLWDKLMVNEINAALNQAKQDYAEMKYKQIIVLFSHMLSIKESYIIAKGGETNPYIIARFIEAFLSIMNPIIPHYCQHVWQSKVQPVLGQRKEILMDNGWPEASPTDRALAAQLKYLEGTKREIRLSLDKAKSGGKRKGKGGKNAPASEEVPMESCIIAIGKTFPEFQQKILSVLQAQPWDSNGVIQGQDYIEAIRKVIPDKKQNGIAMKFAAFVIKEATEVGKEQALMVSSPFNEQELISSNKNFLFENMNTVTNIQILLKEDSKLDSVPNAKLVADNAVPGKPSIIFYSENPAAAQAAPAGGKKGGAPGAGGGKNQQKGGKGGAGKAGGANAALATEVEGKLSDNIWLGGQQPSKEDAEKFASMGSSAPNAESHPEAFAWYTLVGRFSQEVRDSWTAAPAQQPAGGKKGGKGGAQGAQQAAGGKKGGKKGGKEAPKPAAAAAEEDDFDPFADDPEADAAAAEAMKKKGEEAKAKKKKAAPVAKSLIIWEVKPWGEETDLNALADKIIAIQMDGLFWKTEWKKEPVAYGVFKIVIGATVEDDKVSTDLVQEKIEEFEDEVQSVDIVAFNKL